jgi:Leucine-rich repeat (LRR) protein
MFDMTAMLIELPLLQYLNVSFSQIGTIIHDYGKRKLNHLELFDISYATLHKGMFGLPPGKVTFSNIKLTLATKKNFRHFLLFYPKIMNISGLVNAHPHTTIWLINVTFLLNEQHDWKTHELILKNNGLKYLDIQIICNNSTLITTLKYIDLSVNGIEMINPTFFSCVSALENIDLSNNQLGKMASNQPEIWANLLTNVHSLRYINLSNNNIVFVSPTMFKNNPNIETIDLSENELQQIRFTLKTLHRLRYLNLASNRIKILDENSLRILNNFQYQFDNNSVQSTISLDGNPLDCSSCESKTSISWILRLNPLLSVSMERLDCQNKAGKRVGINQAVAKEVQSICERQKFIMISSICACIGTCVFVVAIFAAYKCRKKDQSATQQGKCYP